MTKAVITKKVNPEPLTFSGALDSAIIAQNGDVMRLLVTYSDQVKRKKREKVKVKILELDRYFNQEGKIVDEGSADDTIAEFTGFLENKDGKFFFSEMEPVKEINWSETAPYPWFRIAFGGENDNDKFTNKANNDTSSETFPVVIGKNDEPPESPEFEIGFIIEKEDGTFVGNSGSRVVYFYGSYAYKPFLDLFDIRTELDSVNLLNITNAQVKHAPTEPDDDEVLIQTTVASTTRVYDSTIAAYNEKKMKAIDAALKKIDKLIKTSKNPYFQNIQAVNEYYRTLESYKGQVKQYHEMQKANRYSQGDCYTLERSIIRPMVQDLNRIEGDVHQYLKGTGKPPKSYIDRIDKNISIIKQNDKIDEILKNPAVQIIGLLPGVGVVTGTLKLIQGKHFDGLMDIFGAVVNYGSFLKLSRVARTFRKSSKTTVEMLYSYRYRKLVSSITSTDVMNKVTKMSLDSTGTFLGNLFDTVGTFKSLKGHVDSIALLHRNHDYIIDMTRKAIRGIQAGQITDAYSYLEFLGKLENANAAAEFFAHIRVLHATVKGGKDAYAVTLEAMDDVQEFLGFKDVPGVQEFDSEIVENTRTLFQMMNDRRFRIQEIIDNQTSKMGSTSSIIETFNKSLADYDRFGVNRNADVRYKNTRTEMLLAIDEICDRWAVEQKDRDNWIEARGYSKNDGAMQRAWALKNKSNSFVASPLESRLENFFQKLDGQIKQREALAGKDQNWINLMGLKPSGVDFETGLVYDFDTDYFSEEATELVKQYY